MPCSEMGLFIWIIIHWPKPIFRHEQLFDDRSPYMKFGRNKVIND